MIEARSRWLVEADLGEFEHMSHENQGGAERALRALLEPARRIVALTGAGISTESGIPDYRGPGGVWERNAPPTIGDFLENVETRRRYWVRRRDGFPRMAAAEPNAGHRALVALERGGRLAAVITQNIDGLHQKAGSDPERVLELHGTTHMVRCLACSIETPASTIHARLLAGENPPRCERCGGALRAATILFGESLPEPALRRAVAAARASDLLLVVGTSLIVNPAARLPLLAKGAGARLAIINRTETPLDQVADVVVRGDAGAILAAAVADLEHVGSAA